jgi:hypothetical protein
MNVWEVLTRPRVRPLNYGEAERGFLAEPRPAGRNWLFLIATVPLALGLQYLLRAAGFSALWRHYLPGWGYGLILVALGLLYGYLRPRWHLGSRPHVLTDAAVAMLLTALLFDLNLRFHPGFGQ